MKDKDGPSVYSNRYAMSHTVTNHFIVDTPPRSALTRPVKPRTQKLKPTITITNELRVDEIDIYVLTKKLYKIEEEIKNVKMQSEEIKKKNEWYQHEMQFTDSMYHEMYVKRLHDQEEALKALLLKQEELMKNATEDIEYQKNLVIEDGEAVLAEIREEKRAIQEEIQEKTKIIAQLIEYRDNHGSEFLDLCRMLQDTQDTHSELVQIITNAHKRHKAQLIQDMEKKYVKLNDIAPEKIRETIVRYIAKEIEKNTEFKGELKKLNESAEKKMQMWGDLKKEHEKLRLRLTAKERIYEKRGRVLTRNESN